MKTIITSALTAIVMVLLLGAFKSPTPSLGGFTNYDDMELSGTGTTTLRMLTSTTGKGSCIQMKSTDGFTSSLILNASNTLSVIPGVVCK